MKRLPILFAAFLAAFISAAQNPWIAHDSITSFPANWGSLTDSTLEAKAFADGYHIHVTGNHSKYLSRRFNLDQKHDFKIEATFRLLSVPNEGDPFGLFFAGGESYKQGYQFVIARNGNYRVGQITYTGFNTIAEEHAKGAISKGYRELNKLTVMHREGYWSFCINDVEVAMRKTYPFAGDRFGFFVPAKTEVIITSFKIYDWTLAAGLPAFEKEPVRFVKLYDHFYDNKKEWLLQNNKEVEITMNGHYTMTNKTDGFYSAWNSADLGPFFDNYSIETELVHEGGTDEWGYGLTFGLKDIENRFIFILSDGFAYIAKRKNGSPEVIMKWKEFDFINKGNYATNHLEVRKVNGQWSFYVNHQLVHSCPAQSFFGNNFGLYVEDKQKITMNYIKVTMLYFPK
jgi:hypothetical protein